MAFLAFLLAVGSLIWAYKNETAARELRRQQLQLQRENAQLHDKLNRILAGQERGPSTSAVPTQPPTPAPTPVRTPAPKPVEPLPPPPRVEKPAPVPLPQVMKPVAPPPRPPAAPQQKPAFDWESLVG